MYLALQTLTPELAAPADRIWLVAGMPAVSVATTLFAGALAQFGISPFRLAASAFAATFAFSLLLPPGASHSRSLSKRPSFSASSRTIRRYTDL
jgi:hypothetical protein